MKIIAKKNRYVNGFGKKKVKVLTGGKTYNTLNTYKLISDSNSYVLIKDDSGNVLPYSKKYFISISKNRDSILSKLGLNESNSN